jgi:hypothetical protein
MAFAQGSRSLVSYQEETTWGVNPAGTAGSQQVTFTSGKAGGDPTGLANDETVYDASITLNGGGAQLINVVGEEAQTFTQLLAEINQDLSGGSIALDGGNLVVTSGLLGASSSVAITDTDLFSTLTNFSAIEAAVPGTGAGAASHTSLPYTSFAINLTKDAFQDDTIRSDRRRQFNIHGNRIVGGDVSANLAANAFDDWIASALYSDWSANSISDGVVEKSFTVEQGQLDIAQYSVYTGVKVNTWSVDVPVDGIVTTTFSVQGKDFSISGTPLDATVTDPTISEPFFHAGGTFTIDGVESCISAVNFSVDNGGTANYCLGDDSANNITVGLISVTGSVTVYFEDASIFNNFLNEATAVLNFVLTDGVNSLTFNFPKIKYNGADRTVDGQGPILVTAAFEALSDAGGPVITVTRA